MLCFHKTVQPYIRIIRISTIFVLYYTCFVWILWPIWLSFRWDLGRPYIEIAITFDTVRFLRKWKDPSPHASYWWVRRNPVGGTSLNRNRRRPMRVPPPWHIFVDFQAIQLSRSSFQSYIHGLHFGFWWILDEILWILVEFRNRHNFWWWYPQTLILQPMESWESQLSIGTKISESGDITIENYGDFKFGSPISELP